MLKTIKEKLVELWMVRFRSFPRIQFLYPRYKFFFGKAVVVVYILVISNHISRSVIVQTVGNRSKLDGRRELLSC